jgi:hypothetical protein
MPEREDASLPSRATGLPLLAPRDTVRGLDAVLRRGRGAALALVMAGMLAGWWLYVPVHELLHAGACVAAGGAVTRLEIAPRYGGALLARALPFVVAEGDYAGRLAGFDTGGSDLVYLATDLGPFLLTVLPGVWWLRRSAAREWPFAFGLALPVALAPFVSLAGDAFEIGSILVTRLPPWAGELSVPLRGDDLGLRAAEVAALGGIREWSGLVLAALLGLAWAVLTYALGGRVARALGAPALAAEGVATASGDSGSSSRQRAVPSA